MDPLRPLVRGLRRLGYAADEARERLEIALRTLAELGVEPTEENILQETLCPKAARWRRTERGAALTPR